MALLPSSWNEERVALLRLRWSEGASSGEIALELNVTRNTVIGKAHRLKLATRRRKGRKAAPVRARPQRTHNFHPKAPTPLHERPEPIVVPPMEEVQGGVGILEAQEHHCRAVIGTGDDGLARFCGAPKSSRMHGPYKSSFCEGHASLYYNPIR